MNFIGSMEGSELQLELKYCERCGGLWLRPQGADIVYCHGCRASLEARPRASETTTRQAGRRKGRGRPSGYERTDLHGSDRIDCLQGVEATEVRA